MLVSEITALCFAGLDSPVLFISFKQASRATFANRVSSSVMVLIYRLREEKVTVQDRSKGCQTGPLVYLPALSTTVDLTQSASCGDFFQWIFPKVHCSRLSPPNSCRHCLACCCKKKKMFDGVFCDFFAESDSVSLSSSPPTPPSLPLSHSLSTYLLFICTSLPFPLVHSLISTDSFYMYCNICAHSSNLNVYVGLHKTVVIGKTQRWNNACIRRNILKCKCGADCDHTSRHSDHYQSQQSCEKLLTFPAKKKTYLCSFQSLSQTLVQ